MWARMQNGVHTVGRAAHEQMAQAVRLGCVAVVVDVGVMRSSALQVEPEPSDDRNDERDREVRALLPSGRGESPAIDHPWATSRRRHFTLAHTNHCQIPLQRETDESVSASRGVIVGYAASSLFRNGRS